MSVVNIAGFVVDGMVWVNSTSQGINYYEPYQPENGFGQVGWWFPNDGTYKIDKILLDGKDNARHSGIVYNGTVLMRDGMFYDIKLAGEDHRLMFCHPHAEVMVFATEAQDAFVATYIEHLAQHPELDTADVPWSAERIIGILKSFPGNHEFVPYMPLNELVARVKQLPEVELAPFPRVPNINDRKWLN